MVNGLQTRTFIGEFVNKHRIIFRDHSIKMWSYKTDTGEVFNILTSLFWLITGLKMETKHIFFPRYLDTPHSITVLA